MKEQNNIEGTVDKTSLKCKGEYFLLDFLTTVAPQPSNPLSPITPENIFYLLVLSTFSSCWLHPGHIYCTLQTDSALPHFTQPSIHPSIRQTSNTLIFT